MTKFGEFKYKGELPSCPSAAIRLLEIAQHDDPSLAELCEAIRSDPATSIRVVRAANSTSFGLTHEVTSVERAGMLLGPSTLTTLALAFYLVHQPKGYGSHKTHFDALWSRSVAQSAVAEAILKYKGCAQTGTAFLSGLLADIGQIAIMRMEPDVYTCILNDGPPSIQRERECLGYDHIEVGLSLAREWNLPSIVVDAIQHHHDSAEQVMALTEVENQEVLAAVVLGAIVTDYFDAKQREQVLPALQDACSQLFNLSDEEIVEFLGQAHERVTGALKMFSLTATLDPDISEIMSEATRLLTASAIRQYTATEQVRIEREQLQHDKMLLEQEAEQMRSQVTRDSLTGVFSRGYFDAQILSTIKRAERGGTSFGLLFCDIDHFKTLNDTYGHLAGDEVLRYVGRTIQNATRENDVVARYGGEEFVVVADVDTSEQLSLVAEKVRASIEALQIPFESQALTVTISAGAYFVKSGSRDAQAVAKQIIERADAAMYAAKRGGRNRVVMAECDTRPALANGDVAKPIVLDNPRACSPVAGASNATEPS